MHKFNFPSKYIPVSSSVILIRKHTQQTALSTQDQFDNLNILLLKRNPKISFGGLYAFPGGMVEKQDYVEPWREQLSVERHQDFTKRMCVVRELFEETNILFAQKYDTKAASEEDSLQNYNEKHKSDFLSFSKACNFVPDLDSLYAFQRVASPIGFHPTNDTQFYLYFMDENKEKERPMILNEGEFTEFKWLSPDEALKMYEDKKIPLFPPQLFLITFLKFLSSNFDHLRKDVAVKLQSSQTCY